ncbi:MAG: DUF222 domain-containing protein [Longimicrobiales bacterium]
MPRSFEQEIPRMIGFAGLSATAAVVVRELPSRYESASAPAIYAAGTDATLDLDVLETLGDEIATLAAHIHAATHQLLVLLARFDHLRGWEVEGHHSCAHWLTFRTGIDLGAAREKVRAARALEGLPETSAAMARGELSFSKVRALTRVATADDEAELLELARGCTTAQVERIVRGWRMGSRQDEAARERERHESRTLSVFPDCDGMYVVRGKLPPEVGALLMRAIEAASDALYREEGGVERLAGCGPSSDTLDAAARRRADALGLLVERAMEAGFGGRAGDGKCGGEGGGAAGGEDRTEASVPISGTRAARYQVMLHVDAVTLREDGEASGRSELDDGTRVSAEPSGHFGCRRTCVRIRETVERSETKRPGGSPAMPGWSGSPTRRTARCWMWAGARARFRLRSAAPSRPEIAAAVFQGVARGSPTPIT